MQKMKNNLPKTNNQKDISFSNQKLQNKQSMSCKTKHLRLNNKDWYNRYMYFVSNLSYIRFNLEKLVSID
jgi:hypothetical protein